MDSSPSHPRRRTRKLVLIFLASFLLRAFIAVLVITNETRPKFDEGSYFRRAVALTSILGDLARSQPPQARDKDAFYAHGLWPPFQPIVLAAVMLPFSRSVAAARILMVLLSSLTTVLVFLVTDKLAGPKAGWAASFLHLGYPSFLAFSHYLWSETTYILLLFLALYLALRIPECAPGPRRIRLVILLGLSLGVLALTRSAALLPVLIIPGWILLRSKGTRAKILSPILIVVTMLVTISPWEYALFRREHRFVLISNFNFRNLYQGQFAPQESDEDSAETPAEGQPARALRDYQRERSIPPEVAAKELAIKEIKARPGAFLARGIEKFLTLWTFDFFPLRHAVNVVYPPMSDAAVLLLVLVLVVSPLFLYVLVLKGLLVKDARFKDKALILALILGGALPYVLAYGHSRYNLPQIALLLPVAGFGLANFRERTKAFFPLAGLLVLGFAILVFRSYPGHIRPTLRPSSLYIGSVGALDRVFRAQSSFRDEFIIRSPEPQSADTLTLTIVNDGADDYSFDPREPMIQIVIDRAPNKAVQRFSVYGRRPRRPIELRIFSEKWSQAVQVKPVSRSYWNRFQETGLNGLELNWRGGW